jgi:hypothetical protein
MADAHADTRSIAADIHRLADAAERIADYLCPTEPHRERRPATLTKATYRREGDTPEAWAEVEAAAKRPRTVAAKIRRDE